MMPTDTPRSFFRYISAHDVYRTPEIVKFVFTLGLLISGHSLNPQPAAAVQKKLNSTIVVLSLKQLEHLGIGDNTDRADEVRGLVLSLASFRYISAHDVYRTPEIVKFVFTLGLLISGHSLTPE
jgi:uncharacterized membrane protein YciS (DUF1049 family)